MLLSKYFMPIIKDTPKDAQIISHRLMLRSGMIKQDSAGIYSWLPLGQRVLNKISNIIKCEQDNSGAHEILMPTIQSAELWKESGRYDDYGLEMLRIKDRHDRDILYGPTNEEMVTDIFRSHVKSYRGLPLNLYHVQWKFRDEIRPRFGVMRGREFLMKDAYSFDLNEKSAVNSYNRMFINYLKIFHKMGLKAVPVNADTGPIGGDLSHEFVIVAETGDSKIYCDQRILKKNIDKINYNDEINISKLVKDWTSLYASSEERLNLEEFEALVQEGNRLETNAIEIGHLFYFSTKYSEPLGADIVNEDGTKSFVKMGSYGIGISRLPAAIIEAFHDDKGIIWPESVAPFKVGLVNFTNNDKNCYKVCEEIYEKIQNMGISILYDDRDEGAGSKLADMDLIGIPWQVRVGPKSLANGCVEMKYRKHDDIKQLSIDSLIKKIEEKILNQ